MKTIIALGFGGLIAVSWVGSSVTAAEANPLHPLSREHVEWCQRHYRTYDPTTDTYIRFDGRRHRCLAPF